MKIVGCTLCGGYHGRLWELACMEERIWGALLKGAQALSCNVSMELVRNWPNKPQWWTFEQSSKYAISILMGKNFTKNICTEY